MEEETNCCYRSPEDDEGVRATCQFAAESNADRQPVILGGLKFCLLHAPYSAEELLHDYAAVEDSNNGQFKENWDEAKSKAFNSDIVSGLLGSSEKQNLHGVVFAKDFECKSTVLRQVNFTDCKFSGEVVSFFDTQFHGPWSTFAHSRFSNCMAVFHQTRFGDGAQGVFDSAQFIDSYADFRSSVFADGCSFSEAKFTGLNANFWDTHFNGMLDFRNTEFATDHTRFDINVQNSSRNVDKVQIPMADFTGATFRTQAMFTNREFTNQTTFRSATFFSPPNFHGCSLHQDTVFPPIENFKDTKSEGAAHAYRTLRLAMKQQEAHEEEAMFWALEQRSKRNTSDSGMSAAISWAYDITSKYGLRIGRPAGYLGLWTAITTAIYIAFNSAKKQPNDLGVLADSFGFSIAQVVRPFFVWSDYENRNIKAVFGSDEFSFLIKMLATVDSIVSLTLIALFILAVRRRFRMQ